MMHRRGPLRGAAPNDIVPGYATNFFRTYLTATTRDYADQVLTFAGGCALEAHGPADPGLRKLGTDPRQHDHLEVEDGA